MRVRKSLSRMPQPEREAFLAALLQMKNTIANPLEPDTSKHISIYDQFALIHNAADAQIQLSGATAVDPAHQGSAFGPWHREFLVRFELELQKFDPTVMLPYWDWTDGPGNMNIIFNEFGMGPDGNPGDGDRIGLGYFSYQKPDTGSNTTPLPPALVSWHDERLALRPADCDRPLLQ
ncbi:MAG TPA: tyrosinase family protein [Rhodothermales bacterium]|nr:tyrosinase family protein [Rhodothermales bacterium]